MSAIRHTFIQCDGPKCFEDFGRDTKEFDYKFEYLRAEAKKQGWYHCSGSNTPRAMIGDYCPSCRPTRKKRKGNNGNTRKGASR